MNVTALETSFDLVAPRGDDLMDLFYSSLFAVAPEAKPLFAHTDMKRQKTIPLAALMVLRKSLRNLDAIVPTLHKLGACNAAYGARPEHYGLVSQVLIASLRAIAGPAWTPEYEQAWTEAFELVAGAMMAGAEEAELAAAA